MPHELAVLMNRGLTRLKDGKGKKKKERVNVTRGPIKAERKEKGFLRKRLAAHSLLTLLFSTIPGKIRADFGLSN